MKIKILLLFILLSSALRVGAQNVETGKKLRAKLDSITDPKKKLAAYLNLLNEIGDYDSVGTVKYSAEGITLSRKLNDRKSEAEILRQVGIMYMEFHNDAKAMEYYNQSLKLATAVKANLMIGDIYNNISNLYMGKGNIALRDEYLYKALKVYQQEKAEFEIAMAYSNIGANYNRNGNYAKAVEFMLKSLKIREKIKYDFGIANVAFNITTSFENLNRFDDALKYNKLATDKFTDLKEEAMVAMCYAVRGSVLRAMKKYDEAIVYINKAIPLFEKYKELNGLRNTYDNLGLIYMARNDRARAMEYFNRSKNMSVNLKDPMGIAEADVNIGQAAFDMKDYATVKRIIDEAEPLVRKHDLRKEMHELYQLKVRYAIVNGSPEAGLKTFDSYLAIRDSVTGKDVNQQISELQTKYETEKKDAQIALLNKQRSIDKLRIANQSLQVKQRNILIGAVLILFVVAGLLTYAYYNRQKLKQEAKLQAEIVKQQEIATRSLFEGEQKERIRIARDLHDSIGQMLSVVKMNVSNLNYQYEGNTMIAGTLDIVDKTITEVRNISHNLIPEELNFGLFSALEDMCDKINAGGVTTVTNNIPDDIREYQFEKSNELSIYRIVQEVLSNMVKHAQASEINLDVVRQTNNLLLSIRDNGKGFDTDKISESKGLGWKNIAARVNMLDGKMQIRSEKLTGTQIEITIPE